MNAISDVGIQIQNCIKAKLILDWFLHQISSNWSVYTSSDEEHMPEHQRQSLGVRAWASVQRVSVAFLQPLRGEWNNTTSLSTEASIHLNHFYLDGNKGEAGPIQHMLHLPCFGPTRQR